MKHIGRAVFSLGVLALSPAAAAARCELQAAREATVDAAAASVRVEAGAGSLRIEGRPGTSAVVVRGTACASDQALLDQVRLVAERRGDRVHVEAVLPEGSWWGVGRAYALLDLVIEVPETASLDVDDSSGEASVSGVGTLRIADSSGDLEVRRVRGDLTVRDSSGSLLIADVGGTVRVRDSSGEITVRDAAAVVIEDDGSGGIDVSNVRGSVTIEEDGSGSISVRGVGGDFTVEDDGSGGVEHQDVKGRVRIPSRR